ncbi:MAG TPA: hypothetical protein VK756_07725 [Solirubrobacteraceae bacterium]|jgi:hypothetical protein|nr:hypothetical protein [Solirubrobacteraceae bacterium]
MTAKNEQNILELVAGELATEDEQALSTTILVELGVTSAAKTSYEDIVAVVPFAGTVTGVTYTPEAEEGESGTEYRVFKVEDLTSSQVLAEFSTKAAKIKAAEQKALTLNATAADLVVKAGDILKWKDTSTEGKETKGGVLKITIARTVQSPKANAGEGQATGFVGTE